MSVIRTGNTAHDADLLAAEHTRQVALSASGLTQAQARTADINYATTCLASAIAKNNASNANLFKNMLRELGQAA